MNNGEIGGPRGRGRGWQQPDNQPRELRRPRVFGEEAKGKKGMVYWRATHFLASSIKPYCDVVTS